jgi:hypothetical protein
MTYKPATWEGYPPELAEEARRMALHVATILGDFADEIVTRTRLVRSGVFSQRFGRGDALPKTNSRRRVILFLLSGAALLSATGCPTSTVTDDDDSSPDQDGDGWTLQDGDCDDAEATVFPGAEEICDGLDNDCDGVIPDDEIDDDGDGFDECAGGDCDDTDATTYPGATELCDAIDNDCDCVIPDDEIDDDGDGFDECAGGDCDDADATTYPGATELCDAIDNDCDGVVPGDEIDDDGDGFDECSGGDCDDAIATTYPGAEELCNGVDDDCNSSVPADEDDQDGDGARVCHGDCDDDDPDLNLDDVDGDGFTTCDGDCDDADASLEVADADGDGFTTCDGDCDDTDAVLNLADQDGDGLDSCSGDCDDTHATVLPGLEEICDGLDNDCDVSTDEGVDDDGDGFSECDGDCDDDEPLLAPDVEDLVGDGFDDNCDGIDGTDEDGDGYAADWSGGDDCDDSDLDVWPGYTGWETEGVDANCDGVFGMMLSHSDVAFLGEGADHRSGISVDSAGDVNNDGLDDVLIGAYGVGGYWSYGPGRIYIVFGRYSGWQIGTTMSLNLADVAIDGAANGDRIGYKVAGVGDVNGDGYDDVATSARGFDPGGTGRVHVLFGRAMGWPSSMAAANVNLVSEDFGPFNYEGVTVKPAGDINADGYDDVLVGHYMYGDTGRTYIIFGRTSGWADNLALADVTLDGEYTGDCSGYTLDSAGDINGDGIDDLIIGSPCADEAGADSGKLHLLFGRLGTWPSDLSAADVSMLGEAGEDWSGYQVAGVGDVNGDGLDDVITAAPGNDEAGDWAGKAYVIFGRTTGWPTTVANADISFLGEPGYISGLRRIAAGGDVDGDGFDDILIGSYENGHVAGEAGKTYLIYGRSAGWPTDLSLADAAFAGEAIEDKSSRGLASAGDVDGDGLDDILIGAHQNDEYTSDAGKTYLLFYPF